MPYCNLYIPNSSTRLHTVFIDAYGRYTLDGKSVLRWDNKAISDDYTLMEWVIRKGFEARDFA